MSPKERFDRFHEAHPEIYQEFCKYADQLWNKGWRNYSADGILHVLRFHSHVSGQDTERWKINNNYASFYSRLWSRDNPKRAAFFRTRILKKSQHQ